jgi:type I restriction enzyme R subunit
MQRSYERHLPHQIPEGVPIFLTWCLKGALPKEVLEQLRLKRDELERRPQRAGESPGERNARHAKILFRLSDAYLDRATTGPRRLKEPAAAKIVEDSILFGAVERYELFAWCVMGNHVHVLLTPIWLYEKITQGIKGFTAYKVNELQQERDRVFWQDESFDHWVRDEEELQRIIHYIENNPVAAGLCVRPEDWEWSSARRRANWPPGEPYRPEVTVGRAFQPDSSNR